MIKRIYGRTYKGTMPRVIFSVGAGLFGLLMVNYIAFKTGFSNLIDPIVLAITFFSLMIVVFLLFRIRDRDVREKYYKITNALDTKTPLKVTSGYLLIGRGMYPGGYSARVKDFYPEASIKLSELENSNSSSYLFAFHGGHCFLYAYAYRVDEDWCKDVYITYINPNAPYTFEHRVIDVTLPEGDLVRVEINPTGSERFEVILDSQFVKAKEAEVKLLVKTNRYELNPPRYNYQITLIKSNSSGTVTKEIDLKAKEPIEFIDLTPESIFKLYKILGGRIVGITDFQDITYFLEIELKTSALDKKTTIEELVPIRFEGKLDNYETS
ncbi:hypothetical protein [Acidianus manzaensis]|uniref:Uncharacterized protein n=1 Tax=Acidianus manzaensis TaxID=282676 RepID=A0A1W6JWX2_9CREN|nr:hypothetical protein [Acidianus manzaensis]ARM74714.1 hypothetical protein B6F84_00865 [Acidianus manzaensis]